MGKKKTLGGGSHYTRQGLKPVTVFLEEADYKLLTHLADQERRSIHLQARVLIEKGLRKK